MIKTIVNEPVACAFVGLGMSIAIGLQARGVSAEGISELSMRPDSTLLIIRNTKAADAGTEAAFRRLVDQLIQLLEKAPDA